MIELLERFISPASVEVQPDLTPEFILPDFDEEAFEAEFRTPEDQEQPAISVSMRMAAAVGTAALVTAGVIGYEAGQPDEHQLEVSAEQITEDLNSGDRTTEPVIIEQGSKIVIPKEEANDTPISVVNPIRLADEKYGAVVFDDNGKVKVVEIPSDASPTPVEPDSKETAEANEIVYPISVVYTEVPTNTGESERVYSAVAGDESGNSANVVKISDKNATPEQKRLLKDKALKKLVQDAVGLAAQERVGYLDIAK